MSWQAEVEKGKRFEFGKNWSLFLETLDEERMREARGSLCQFLGAQDLNGRTFLDIGSGSGLFSLAAKQLGSSVRSFDYDANSVKCTETLKQRYFPGAKDWEITPGSILDRAFVESLGSFDICYSWGVLHHTGHLWHALFNAQIPVKKGGLLFVAIYNDEGIVSAFWKIIKRLYCSHPAPRALLTAMFFSIFFLAGLLADIAGLKNPAKRYEEHKKHRGMSLVHDWRDWLGGYPYEVATHETVASFLGNLGFEQVVFKKPPIGFGNNQFVFRKAR